MVICRICKMAVPLDAIDQIGLGYCHLPKNCHGGIRIVVTMAICLESVDRIWSTDSSRTLTKASKWPFFTTIPTRTAVKMAILMAVRTTVRNELSRQFLWKHHDNLFLTVVPTAVRMISWHYKVPANAILTTVPNAVRIFTDLVLSTLSNHRENVYHDS